MGWFNAMIERRTLRAWVPFAILLLSGALATAAVLTMASGTASGTTATCLNTATLSGSAFEIDTDANQVVDNSNNSTGCIDWLDTSADPGTQQDAIVKQDTTSGSTDESFGNGTKEDTAEPSVVDGGIPPNKSDLKAFGVFTERAQGTSGFLELLWTRVQDPTGTTNMDFELNQKFCDTSATPTNCAPNGKTPLRTSGDKLITYDLSRGGTSATISIRNWDGSAWGPATVLTSETPPQALGTINTSQITAANSLSSLGALSPRTFGEASISFDALFGQGACGQFGSAYLKSRSSDSFTAALKDFVPPQQVDISNCPAGLTTTASSATIGGAIHDTAHLDTGNTSPTGTITFTAYDNSTCSGTAVFTSSAIPVNGDGDYPSGDFTPTAAGDYYWTATYSGDGSHDPVSTACGDPGEKSTVSKAAGSLTTAQDFLPNDTANVTGTGAVTFTLYTGGTASTCTGGTPVYTETKTPSGGKASTSNTTNLVKATTDLYWIVSQLADDAHDAPADSCENSTLTITN